MTTTRVWASLAAFGLVLALSGCGGDEDTAGTDATGDAGPTTIAVALQEFTILPDQNTAPAGSVTFAATNNGPEDNHELVVMKTDLAPEDLPKLDDGSVDEGGAGIELIGEIEEFPPGEMMEATFTMTAGSYVLVCNLVETTEEGTTEVHYQLGMRTGFTVS